MHYSKISRFIVILITVLLLAGCNTQVPQTGLVPLPASAEPTAALQSPQPEQSEEQTKEANWVIEIEDTQQITDEEGLIWNYALSMYAVKTGGKDVLGDYTGEIVLNMEPDFESAKALAEREGAELLAMLFKHHSEAKNITFEVIKYSPEAYAELMKENIPDNPLLQISNPSASMIGFAIKTITFEATQEPINMTVAGENGTYSGTIPGKKVSVNVPMEITIEDATAFCHLFETVHPLERSFKGIVTGDIVN
jgi:hypothetical protein